METRELQHFGVKGMKWGVRKDRKDTKTTRTLRRHLSADKKHLRNQGEILDQEKSNYDRAANEYKQALSRMVLFNRAKHHAAIDAASKKMTEAGAKLTRSKANLNRAVRIYDADEAKYREHVNKMIEKYGAENVKNIRTTTMKLGEHYTKNVIRTGITLADLPLIGSRYSGHYVGEKEYQDRMANIDEAANKRY